jgi:hypothetical protein
LREVVKEFTWGFGEQVHGLQIVPVVVPSLEVKSYILSSRMTRAVESLNHVVSCAREDGTEGVALPPPVVPAARPNGVPTADAVRRRARAAQTNSGEMANIFSSDV